MELLHGEEEIHEEGDEADPECRHRNEYKPLPHRLFPVVRRGAEHAYKPCQTAHLVRG